jgi:hypothetical protein
MGPSIWSNAAYTETTPRAADSLAVRTEITAPVMAAVILSVKPILVRERRPIERLPQQLPVR